VVSLAGHRARLVDGLLPAIAEAVARIDLREHRGVHPRVGAADVVPIPWATAVIRTRSLSQVTS
jgi:glutamate formiminotransferase / 5-formyltetrahydrofolate cyclo-ligase